MTHPTKQQCTCGIGGATGSRHHPDCVRYVSEQTPPSSSNEMMERLASAGTYDASPPAREAMDWAHSQLKRLRAALEKIIDFDPRDVRATLGRKALSGNWSPVETSELPESLRDPIRVMNIIDAMKVAESVFEQYKLDHPKWWKRMDGTPILNDIIVRMAKAFTPPAQETSREPQVGDEVTLHFTSSLVKSREGWKIDRIAREEYFFLSDGHGSQISLLRGQFSLNGKAD